MDYTDVSHARRDDLGFDRIVDVYRKSGVQFYWIVDPAEKSIEAYRRR